MKIPKCIQLFGVIGLVCLVTLAMVSAAAADPNVCRDLPASANPGDTITVKLDITLDGADKTVIEDNVPAGWVVSNPSDGGFVVDDNTVGWTNSGAAPGDNQFTYDVTIPGDAAPGTYDFDGVFDLNVAAPGLQAIDCETQMDVEAAQNGGEPNVCRDLPATANPGDTITVKLDITLDGADKTVIEDNVPAGWVVSNPSDGGFVVDDNTVGWTNSGAAPGDNQFTYDVTIPGAAAPGTYDFDGVFDLNVAAPGLQAIDCETQMDVEAAQNGGEPNVCRDLPATANPGDTITVKLDITLDGADKTVIEDNVPAGWVVSNPSDGGFVVDDNTVGWTNSGAAPGDNQFTYDVTIPGDAAPGTYDFDGVFDLNVAAPGLQPIDCETQMDVEAAQNGGEPNVCRDLPATANPGDTITVKLDITLDGADKTVLEDNVPAGWVVSNPSDGGFVVDDNTVGWTNSGAAPGDNQFTYDVTIPGDAALGTYDFDGVFDLNVAAPGLQPIDCETQMEVVEEPVEPPEEPEGIVIEEGWNFISVPYYLNNSTVEFVLADINYSTIMYYNASYDNCSGMWEIPTTLDPLCGYWIESDETEDQVITLDVLEPMVPTVPPTKTLCAGWNAIGYSDAMTTLPAELALSSIDESYTTIKGPYDPANMTYEQIGHNGETGVIAGNHVGTDIFEVSPFDGFWVYLTQEDTLVG
ncbi:hypothetical protein J2755_002078 [Methanohalophilus levihalophilus]|uniref:hypothetical protein n=1 Tax=Methanohalophilus levihalophilus TaxID=1431282 RepID=UPI001AE682CD|nr:hypothetical protein [Methanohalophilus levihalophilus]MBP2031130.1 hypothetical protein [Methanohalophilus levihalophilus]